MVFYLCTFNPNISESDYGSSPWLQNSQYWLNHVAPNGNIVSNSGVGAKCKVELISRTQLLNARGYKVRSLTATSKLEIDLQSSFTYQIIEEDGTPPIVQPPVANFEFEIMG